MITVHYQNFIDVMKTKKRKSSKEIIGKHFSELKALSVQIEGAHKVSNRKDKDTLTLITVTPKKMRDKRTF